MLPRDSRPLTVTARRRHVPGTVGCAHTSDLEPVRIRPGQPSHYSDADLRDRPIVVEFHEGDVIPFDFTVEGDLVSAPAT